MDKAVAHRECKDCRFMWPVLEGAQLPSCHYNPPNYTAIPIPVQQKRNLMSAEPAQQNIQWLEQGGWPPVQPEGPNSGCGKFEESRELDS